MSKVITLENTTPNIGYEDPEIADINIAINIKTFGSLYFKSLLNPDVYENSSIILLISSSASLSFWFASSNFSCTIGSTSLIAAGVSKNTSLFINLALELSIDD